MATAPAPLKPWLHASDPRLPMLATRAAVELDNLKRGVPTDRQAVRDLSDLLRNSFEQPEGDQASANRQSLLDSGTIVLIGKALGAGQVGSVTKVNQLRELAEEIAAGLEQSVANEANQPLARLRDFCLALAREAATYQRSFRSLRPSHPFRR